MTLKLFLLFIGIPFSYLIFKVWTASTKNKKNRHSHKNIIPATHNIPATQNPPKKVISNQANSIKKTNEAHWNLELLKAIEWKRYEDVCKEYLKLRHCDANTTCIGADGGIDIKIVNSENKTIALAQCKAYNNPIKVNLVRELYGVMAHEKVRTGIFLTTSTFSKDAQEFAKEKQLLLIDGNEMIKLINEMEPEKQRALYETATEGDYKTPTCARCDTKMILRKGPKGDFWGCKNFPKCKSTLQVRV